jgi:hypothetical protein
MGRKVEGVGVMKDKELKLDEMKASHTRGGACKTVPRLILLQIIKPQ